VEVAKQGAQVAEEVKRTEQRIEDDLKSIQKNLQEMSAKNSKPKARVEDVPMMLVSSLSPLSGGVPGGYSVTMTAAGRPGSSQGGGGVSPNKAKGRGEELVPALMACPKLADPTRGSTAMPLPRVRTPNMSGMRPTNIRQRLSLPRYDDLNASPGQVRAASPAAIGPGRDVENPRDGKGSGWKSPMKNYRDNEPQLRRPAPNHIHNTVL